MKEEYVVPEMDIIAIESEDVIMASDEQRIRENDLPFEGAEETESILGNISGF